MAKKPKAQVDKETTLDMLDIRLGHILEIEDAPGTHKPAYKMKIDFGGDFHRISVGRFTHTPREELLGKEIVGIVNFPSRDVGDTESQALVLGVQFPKVESLEATPLVPLQSQTLDQTSLDQKPVVDWSETFGRLEIRLGRIQKAEETSLVPSPFYSLEVDFGKFQSKKAVAPFSQVPPNELVGRLVVGVLNFEPQKIGDLESEAFLLGVPDPVVADNEKVPLIPLHPNPKIGGKVF